MPLLTKSVLSQYIRTECKRQLRLSLSPDNAAFRAERVDQRMPAPQPPRPGLAAITAAGRAWEAEKLNELHRHFGSARVQGAATPGADGQIVFGQSALAGLIATARPGEVLVQARYDVGQTFERAHGIEALRTRYALRYADLIPDLIFVLAPGSRSAAVDAAGEVYPLEATDARVPLRVADIKLTAEATPGYFAEIAFYTMALAGWLEDHGLADRYVVAADGAVWPGSHEMSAITVCINEAAAAGRSPATSELETALESELEPIPFEVFAIRVRRFLRTDLSAVLGEPWDRLPWHVDGRCRNCEYLGQHWVNASGELTSQPEHCMPLAQETGHLSRVAFMSVGGRRMLEQGGVSDVGALAQQPAASEVFDRHQSLRTSRTVISGRAAALQTDLPAIPDQAGTSAIMPRWADLSIYITCDFDIGSAITFSLGLQAFWMGPGGAGARPHNAWQARVFPIDQKSVAVEQREFLAFLQHLHGILTDGRLPRDTTVQIYIWDRLRYDHLCRLVGRHLAAVLNQQSIAHLAWLFPPEELLPNPAGETRNSPITIVQDVVRAVVAAPVPHYYSLFNVARRYHHPSLPANLAEFSVHPLFEDALSDQIPSERAHEIWTRSSSTNANWAQRLQQLQETVSKQLRALETIVRRLGSDLRDSLGYTAPRIAIGPPDRQNRMSHDGQLWYAFNRLNDAMSRLEVDQIRAMPVHEREARFKSARLEHLLTGPQEGEALLALGLPSRAGRRVYRLAESSREVAIQDGEIGVALAPAGSPGFLDRSFSRLVNGSAIPVQGWELGWKTEKVTAVTVVAIDRERRVVVIDETIMKPGILDALERERLADLSRDVVLDPVFLDIFHKKLKDVLAAIGTPQIAVDHPLAARATGMANRRRGTASPLTPVAEALWNARGLEATSVACDLPLVRASLDRAGRRLNASQQTALERALSRRLSLIWGPPGTGKSRTLVSTVLAACLHAVEQGRPLRVLVTAFTWGAIDNVLLPVADELTRLAPDVMAARVRSSTGKGLPPQHRRLDFELNRRSPSPEVRALKDRLQDRFGVTIVGSTAQQVHNLMQMDGEDTEELFDLIVVDEGSQMDVAHAIVSLASLAAGGSIVCAADWLQLPPIHAAEAPLGLEHMVGSIYRFFRDHHGVAETQLTTNYRSNSTIVEATRLAGYGPELHAWSPDLRIRLLSPFDAERPDDWPDALEWSPAWSQMLAADKPASCFVYQEGLSSQWNRFEAQAIVAITWSLWRRLAREIENERDDLGRVRPSLGTPHDAQSFWTRGIGIVTPHRAQQGLVVSMLQSLFVPLGHDAAAVRSAVDTVERFQGQERDVVLATFALGDPDAIGDEDEFLLSLNRFNVMASRARAKLVTFVSQEIVDHLSSDIETLRGSRLLKLFAESYCSDRLPLILPWRDAGELRQVPGEFRWRPSSV